MSQFTFNIPSPVNRQQRSQSQPLYDEKETDTTTSSEQPISRIHDTSTSQQPVSRIRARDRRMGNKQIGKKIDDDSYALPRVLDRTLANDPTPIPSSRDEPSQPSQPEPQPQHNLDSTLSRAGRLHHASHRKHTHPITSQHMNVMSLLDAMKRNGKGESSKELLSADATDTTLPEPPIKSDVELANLEAGTTSPTPAPAPVSAPTDDPHAHKLGREQPISFIDRCSSWSSCLSNVTRYMSQRWGWGNTREAHRQMREGVPLLPHHNTINEHGMKSTLASYPHDAILGITIRACDPLQPDIHITHPMIRIHVVDSVTGQWLAKSDITRTVTYPSENNRYSKSTSQPITNADSYGTLMTSTPTTHILPILSHPCETMLSTSSFAPTWNECVIINEKLTHVLKPNVMLFFELLEFGSHVDLEKYPDGYYPIAWAFLRLLSTHGIPNIHATIHHQRLQLFRYSTSQHIIHAYRDGIPHVWFHWVWQSTRKQRELYPSTIYVSIHGYEPLQEKSVKGERPILPTHREEGRLRYETMRHLIRMDAEDATGGSILSSNTHIPRAIHEMTQAQKRALARTRAPTAPCRIPNTPLLHISCGHHGCFVLRYSPDGKWLAAACAEELMFTIKIYAQETGAHVFTFVGHHDLIYDLCWSPSGDSLISASSDSTAKIWTWSPEPRTTPAHTLQHTGFVYTAQYHPRMGKENAMVMTGAYDGMIRIWDSIIGTLLTTLSEHSTHVNTITFTPNGTRFFSGDAAGVIRIWEDTYLTRANEDDDDLSSIDYSTRFRLFRTIEHPRMTSSISCLRYHPRPERLVAYCRDNAVYAFSMLRYELKHVLGGVQSRHAAMRVTISPDGMYAAAGSEDGHAYIWELSTGHLINVMDVGYHHPLMDIAWHPTEHAIAFCCYGGDYPIIIYEYDGAVAMKQSLATSPRSNSLSINTDAPTTVMGLGATSTSPLAADTGINPAIPTGAAALRASLSIRAQRSATLTSTGKPVRLEPLDKKHSV